MPVKGTPNCVCPYILVHIWVVCLTTGHRGILRCRSLECYSQGGNKTGWYSACVVRCAHGVACRVDHRSPALDRWNKKYLFKKLSNYHASMMLLITTDVTLSASGNGLSLLLCHYFNEIWINRSLLTSRDHSWIYGSKYVTKFCQALICYHIHICKYYHTLIRC